MPLALSHFHEVPHGLRRLHLLQEALAQVLRAGSPGHDRLRRDHHARHPGPDGGEVPRQARPDLPGLHDHLPPDEGHGGPLRDVPDRFRRQAGRRRGDPAAQHDPSGHLLLRDASHRGDHGAEQPAVFRPGAGAPVQRLGLQGPRHARPAGQPHDRPAAQDEGQADCLHLHRRLPALPEEPAIPAGGQKEEDGRRREDGPRRVQVEGLHRKVRPEPAAAEDRLRGRGHVPVHGRHHRRIQGLHAHPCQPEQAGPAGRGLVPAVQEGRRGLPRGPSHLPRLRHDGRHEHLRPHGLGRRPHPPGPSRRSCWRRSASSVPPSRRSCRPCTSGC